MTSDRETRKALGNALLNFSSVTKQLAMPHSSHTHETLCAERDATVAVLVDIFAPEKPALRSLKNHNDAVLASQNATVKGGTGVACPICNAELFFIDNAVMTSNPPQRSTRCVNNHFHNIFVRG